uniref:Uncharacterized protein n=1 Tax=viral metagenome TaxID=1070528 RepID=A0A6C0B2H6_9ZZZZ
MQDDGRAKSNKDLGTHNHNNSSGTNGAYDGVYVYDDGYGGLTKRKRKMTMKTRKMKTSYEITR